MVAESAREERFARRGGSRASADLGKTRARRTRNAGAHCSPLMLVAPCCRHLHGYRADPVAVDHFPAEAERDEREGLVVIHDLVGRLRVGHGIGRRRPPSLGSPAQGMRKRFLAGNAAPAVAAPALGVVRRRRRGQRSRLGAWPNL